MLNRELGHAVGELDEDVFNWDGGVRGEVVLNGDKATDADLLMDDVITRVKTVGINLVSEAGGGTLFVLSRSGSRGGTHQKTAVALQFLQAPLLLKLDELNVLVGLDGIHGGGGGGRGSTRGISLALVAANPSIEGGDGVSVEGIIAVIIIIIILRIPRTTVVGEGEREGRQYLLLGVGDGSNEGVLRVVDEMDMFIMAAAKRRAECPKSRRIARRRGGGGKFEGVDKVGS